MNTKTTLLFGASVLAASLALAGCTSTGGSTMGSSAGMGGMSGTYSSSSTTAGGSHTTSDLMFAEMMLPHHQEAITMSDTLLAKGTGVDPRVLALATRIKKEQAPEIVALTGWISDWNGSTSSTSMGSTMGGMMSEGDMTALEHASASRAGKLYLQQMIQHHQGAVTMAETEVKSGSNTGAVALAKSIVRSQTAEITEMKSLLATQ